MKWQEEKNSKGRVQLYTSQGNSLGDNKSSCIGLAALIGILSYWIKFEFKKKKRKSDSKKWISLTNTFEISLVLCILYIIYCLLWIWKKKKRWIPTLFFYITLFFSPEVAEISCLLVQMEGTLNVYKSDHVPGNSSTLYLTGKKSNHTKTVTQ